MAKSLEVDLWTFFRGTFDILAPKGAWTLWDPTPRNGAPGNSCKIVRKRVSERKFAREEESKKSIGDTKVMDWWWHNGVLEYCSEYL